jgi:alanyl-tRNA synthetase
MQLVGVVVKTFGEAYPELVKHQEKIHAVIAEEEASFSRTLGKGIERFKKLAAAAQVRQQYCLYQSCQTCKNCY